MSRSQSKTATFAFDEHSIPICSGDTIAASLMREGILVTRRSNLGEARGVFCAIGICNDCLVTVDGVTNVRACLAVAMAGLRVTRGGA
jgi:predicted molibdopterin-dependent oxidoreductase YjgC